MEEDPSNPLIHEPNIDASRNDHVVPRLPKAEDIAKLQTACTKERSKWSTLYNAKTIEGKKFRTHIDKYRQDRAAFMRDWQDEQLTKGAFHNKSNELGSQLAQAFGFLNESRNDWNDTVKKRTKTAATDYAEPSIGGTIRAATPGILRAAIFAGLQMARLALPQEHASTIVAVQASVYVTYAAIQILAIGYVPIWQSAQQSKAVALQTARGPAEMPDVKSDKRLGEDGTEKKLRRLEEINKDLAAQHSTSLSNEHDITELYTQLVVTYRSGLVRGRRSKLNLAAAVSGLASNIGVAAGIENIAQFPNIDRAWQIGLGALTTALLVAQPMAYARWYPTAVAQDQLDKLATQFQIAAATGLGNFDEPDGKLSMKKLDKFIRGPIKLRIDNLKAALEYDRKVYLTALLAIQRTDKLLEKSEIYRSFDEIMEIFLESEPERGRADMFIGTRNYENIEYRAINAIVKLFNNNEKNIKAATACDLNTLFKKNALPDATAEMFFSALKCAANLNPQERDFEFDDKLSELKGQTESRVDIASTHQAAQKLGQSLQSVVFGSAGPNLIKAITNLIQGALIVADAKKYETVLTSVGATQNALQILVCLGAICAGMQYQKNVALKNVFRDRDKDKSSLPNSGVMKSDNLINTHRGTISQFETLAAQSIADEHLPAHSLNYTLDTSFAKDVLAHANAFDLREFFSEKIARGGTLKFDHLEEIFETAEDAEETIENSLNTLALLAGGTQKKPAHVKFNIVSSSSMSSANPSGGTSTSSASSS